MMALWIAFSWSLLCLYGYVVFTQETSLHIPCENRTTFFRFPRGGESHLHVHVDPPRQGNTDRYINCAANLSVPAGKFISLRFNSFQVSTAACKDVRTKVRIISDEFIIARVYACDKPALFHCESESAKLLVQYRPKDPPHSATIAVMVNDEDGWINLRVAYQTNTSGTITPYGFNGLLGYASNTNTNTLLLVPPSHSVMLSFPHFHIHPSPGCTEDKLRLKIFRRVDRTLTFVWVRCGTLQLPPDFIPQIDDNYAAILCFKFHTEMTRGYTGFVMQFSFHGASEEPQKITTENSITPIFNCSVPFYAHFSQHLNCNLETECVYAEDEASCPYSHGACKPGFLNAGNKCYKYIKTKKIMTWFDASMVCLEQGLMLASFHTQKQLSAFLANVLRFAHTTFKVFIGLRTSDSSLPAMYREVWQWSSGIMAYFVHFQEQVFKPTCGSFAALSRDLTPSECGLNEHMQFIFCEPETPSVLNISRNVYLSPLNVSPTIRRNDSIRFVTCAEGHMTHDFLSCDYVTRCGADRGSKSCATNGTIPSAAVRSPLKIMMYVCDSETQTIHFTQVCDHYPQCSDSSDESFCVHPGCVDKRCLNQQCVTAAQWCDGMAHCFDSSDEGCPQFVTGLSIPASRSSSGLRVVFFDGHGKYEYVVPAQVTEFPSCPPTHFMCANRELCIPIFLRCNGVHDCSDREDEDDCDDVKCPGYYRCRGSAVCVHNSHVCDGMFQCPQQDDELLCQLACPDNCRCQGLAFVCLRLFPVHVYSDLRYLDASQSGLNPKRLFHNHYLIRLSLSNCGLNALPVLEFPNMKFLDLSNNILTNVSMKLFLRLSNLNVLSLSGNPINSLIAPASKTILENVYSLDLSHTKLKYFESSVFYNVRNIKDLNLSNGLLRNIGNNGFQSLTKIESLDLRRTELRQYPVRMLQPLSSLRFLFSDVFKLCCPDILPTQFNPQNCHTSPDEISSCKDLLRSDIYRIFLWFTCSIAVAGNVGSLLSKLYLNRGKPPNSFNVFVAHLHVSDFFMGLYLAMVGSADQIYRGAYLWHDEQWKQSSTCKIAGFFSLLSCEMSAFSICFITLDRLLVIRFPFSQLHFGNLSAQVVCGFSWGVGVALAALPLLPVTEHWEFYSQTDICVPLPVTRRDFDGRFYSFGILIVLNFLLFVLIAVGQLLIYVSIRSNSMVTDQKKEREATVARRLLTVVMSDFLCWFPVGLLGLLASNGIIIPSEVNVILAIFALPLNSALNPFLYTVNLLIEKRRKASEQRLLKMLQMKYSS